MAADSGSRSGRWWRRGRARGRERGSVHTRRFELPGIHELTKEQELVRALPKEGRHLIVGGPGTGKTVMALLRARRHERSGDDYKFLVYTHLLHRASRALADEQIAASTWKSWFWKIYPRAVGKGVPTKEAESGGWRREDWEAVRRAVDNLDSDPSGGDRPFLVIDEGQDMPPDFYDCLVNLGFENFFVAADQNQQITEEHSSRSDLEASLLVETHEVIELTLNHRNTRPIARLARAFRTDDPASQPPRLPSPDGGSRGVATPRLDFYDGNDNGSLHKIARGIWENWDRDPRRLVGVIAPNNQVRQRWFDALEAVSAKLDNERPQPMTFHRDHRPDIPWDRGGVLVINAQACKGLEFDTVVLADIDEHLFDAADPDRTKKLFYVMVSRARERVFLFMKRGGYGGIEGILPKDEDVLRRGEFPSG